MGWPLRSLVAGPVSLVALALFQVGEAVSAAADSRSAEAYERLGVASILVTAAYFLIRYFMGLLEKKEVRLNDVTDRFLAATEAHTETIAEFTQEVREMRMTHASLASAIAELKRDAP
jgi:Mg2+ and Co2+ transporter CorA